MPSQYFARGLAISASSLALALALAAALPGSALADSAAAAAAPASTSTATDVQEVVVNGIPYKETVLPTRLKSSSVYGLDLNVMDTPRNTTLLSTTQLETLNIEDPRAFSYLTASSYTDSAFGTPNIPRIRGQYADVFYNGMRSSFSDNGYGAPPNFDSLENISITKGPASVIDGPGPGVGGEADFLTKRPDMNKFVIQGSASLDTLENRRLTVDVGGPILPGVLGLRISYSGEDNDSWFYSHYFHKNAVYAAVKWTPNDKYQLDFNTELNVEQYTENVGLNRVNQSLINNALYLQGAPVGELYSTAFGGSPLPIGSPGNPYSPAAPFLTEVELTNEVPINTKITIDQTPGVSSRAELFNAQLIQSYSFTDNLKLENNTFFAFQNSDNQEPYYYSDASNGSWTFESRTDLTYKNHWGAIQNEMIGGATFRFAHVNYISNFDAEVPSVFDLTSNPALWTFSGATQLNYTDAELYTSPFGRQQYGTPGRDATNAGNTGVSDLYDTGFFFQDRVSFTQELSVLFGGRIDLAQDHTHDPLGGAICTLCYNTLPQDHTTGVYGDGQANVSAVYRPNNWVSGYLTFDWTQSQAPNGGEGGINAYGQVPDHTLMRSDSYLYELGLKFNLLNKKLFAGTAVFDQKRSIPTGNGGTTLDKANIRGVEIELNYQPTRNLFLTASYSYIATTLNNAPGFYNFPASNANNYPGQPYNFIDGAATGIVWQSGQKFDDPGVPRQVANLLANYKFPNGIGIRGGAQVTGPIATTPSGYINVAASNAVYGFPIIPASAVNSAGYYQSPTIPWQYTLNAAIFYKFKNYTITASIYNLTNRLNWQSSPIFYGNDFLVRDDQRSYEIRLQYKF